MKTPRLGGVPDSIQDIELEHRTRAVPAAFNPTLHLCAKAASAKARESRAAENSA